MPAPVTLDRNAMIEWPTLALFGFIYAAWLALVWFHAAIPLWLWMPAAAWISAWWGSAQHEALHGHPTRSRAINTALATPPFWLWLPFERYRQTHLTHHNDERLTDPLDDPETRYYTEEAWQNLSPVVQAIIRWQGTLLGRLVIGPIWATLIFWKDDLKSMRAGDRKLRQIWLLHAVFVGLMLVFVIGIAGMPFWQYVLGFAYFGTALALIRSFAEHKAETLVERRTAIVENSPVMGLLFLNNNLHVAHHKWPTVAWYRLPQLYRENRAALIEENGGLVYNSYRDVFERFFVKPYSQPVHPLGRAPRNDDRPDTPQAGSG